MTDIKSMLNKPDSFLQENGSNKINFKHLKFLKKDCRALTSLSSIVMVLLMFIIFNSCGKKDEHVTGNSSSKDFTWKSELKITDIPESPVKGFIDGKEIKPVYINFEQWRGSGDNVLNFGDVIPKNNCGFIESDNSFHLIHKAGEIKSGELLKASFEQNLDGYVAYYNKAGEDQSKKTSYPWDCALVITSMDEKNISGKIAICFKDDKKSWIAGTFEAIRCNN